MAVRVKWTISTFVNQARQKTEQLKGGSTNSADHG